MLFYGMEGTEYALVDEHDRIHCASEDVAVAFSFSPDEDRGMQGSPDRVSAWAITTRKKFVDAGHLDMAKEIVVVSGKIPLEDLNKIINTSGYVGTWYKRILAGEVVI